MRFADYRLLVSTVTDDRGALTRAEQVARAALTKAELAQVRELLRQNWQGFPDGWEAISLTFTWSDECDLTPRKGRQDKDGVVPVDVAVPVQGLLRSLREDRYHGLVRWLLLSTVVALSERCGSKPVPAPLAAALAATDDYTDYLQGNH